MLLYCRFAIILRCLRLNFSFFGFVMLFSGRVEILLLHLPSPFEFPLSFPSSAPAMQDFLWFVAWICLIFLSSIDLLLGEARGDGARENRSRRDTVRAGRIQSRCLPLRCYSPSLNPIRLLLIRPPAFSLDSRRIKCIRLRFDKVGCIPMRVEHPALHDFL